MGAFCTAENMRPKPGAQGPALAKNTFWSFYTAEDNLCAEVRCRQQGAAIMKFKGSFYVKSS
jgi:hypothetical protein